MHLNGFQCSVKYIFRLITKLQELEGNKILDSQYTPSKLQVHPLMEPFLCVSQQIIKRILQILVNYNYLLSMQGYVSTKYTTIHTSAKSKTIQNLVMMSSFSIGYSNRKGGLVMSI